MGWSPDLYRKFQEERFAPFDDLVALAAFLPGMRMVDLGCGTGELTARLAGLSPGSTVLGLDSSPSMLAKAQPLAKGGLRFALGKIEDWDESGLDVVFSHAALQWVEDHEALFRRLARAGARGAAPRPDAVEPRPRLAPGGARARGEPRLERQARRLRPPLAGADDRLLRRAPPRGGPHAADRDREGLRPRPRRLGRRARLDQGDAPRPLPREARRERVLLPRRARRAPGAGVSGEALLLRLPPDAHPRQASVVATGSGRASRA